MSYICLDCFEQFESNEAFVAHVNPLVCIAINPTTKIIQDIKELRAELNKAHQEIINLLNKLVNNC